MTKQLSVPIKGMHCTACEILTEEKLAAVSGVKAVKSNYRLGRAMVDYEGREPELAKVKQAVTAAGYEYGEDDLPLLSKQTDDYYEFAQALIVFLVLYFVLKMTGVGELVNTQVGSSIASPVVLLIGLTAGFSSCMALVGGLVLSVTANYAELHKNTKTINKFRPHIYFNLGRVLGYAVLGAVLGATGSAVHLSAGLAGWLMLIIALVMTALGLKLIGLFPVLNRFNLALPKSVAAWFNFSGRTDNGYSHLKTMILGAATFFVPCGFTQAMQLYALGSGSALTGALTMGLFALGTVPGLLGLGAVVALVKGKWSAVFFRLAGIVVIAFGLFNLRNTSNLIGVSSWAIFKDSASVTKSIDQDESGEQIIRMTQTSRGYSPKNFTVEAGRPVKWIIDSQDANSCAASIVAPKIDVNMQLKAGENVIKFMPKEAGMINFTCSMGMYRGSIKVLEAGKPSSWLGAEAAEAAINAVESPKSKVVSPAVLKQGSKLKVFTTTYTLAKDIVPSTFRTKVGQATRIDVKVKDDGKGCMRAIKIQGLAETPIDLVAGETIKLSFTPQKKGKYLITCAMNIPRGTVIVD